ncbi:hypothetical protein EUX98_g169 [Antrodiella citrinella]|uniref:UBC core domain-containing protein n=1 Tax=Antrodiella citrinella TaxID=2447956 RepID=A0A4S4N6G4_9APHY|nr:hypothetical protein EUX98_g169 [Antrodiella citrinella]
MSTEVGMQSQAKDAVESLKPQRRAKLYQEDIVELVDSPGTLGLVMHIDMYLGPQRCWHDAEDLPPIPDDEIVDPLLRTLKQGEVGISFYTKGTREILPESKLQLVDRSYQPGDLLKRSVDDVQAGVVTSIEVTGLLEHTINGQEIPGWRSTDETECDLEVDMGDYVVYDDWVGQVIEMFDEAVIEMGDGTLVRLPELTARLSVGEKGAHILPTPMPGMHNLFGFLTGNARPSAQDTVLSVRRTVLAIAWLAVNQTLSPEVASARQRPQRFWHGPDLAKLTLVRRRAEQTMRVGDRVLLKNAAEMPVSVHGKEGAQHGLIEVRTLALKRTRTLVNVLWQDGKRECLDARDTVPYLNPDEYDCWPGDHVFWKDDDNKRPAVVQSVEAAERTAVIRFNDTDKLELASVLELDPHGTTDWAGIGSHEGLGLGRGDFVFIHPEGANNGALPPSVPRIGELEPWVRETTGLNGQPGSWRREMVMLGNQIATRRSSDSVDEGRIRRLLPGDTSLNWFGEVIDQCLDGTVKVLLPDSTAVILPLWRLTRLYDGLEQLEDMWDDGSDDDLDSLNGIGASDGADSAGFWALDDNGHWVEETADVDGDDWSTDNEDDRMSIEVERWPSPPSGPTPLQTAEPDSVVSVLASKDTQDNVPVIVDDIPSPPAISVTLANSAQTETSVVTEPANLEETSQWKRFEVLSSAPADHAFFTSAPAHPSRTFLARLSKEYKVLESSLPDTILVRAYEDRTDLLRSMIIGPDNTPYQDAPFVIDWQLDSNFPHSPPIAHFLSWTNGNGRVNPNLYEEGKVCLSILGTWAGDKNETWNAARSSLLQCLISIQGLVLVKEPWFCEPAYEKLRGTEEGIINSRLYSEKAYVLSRGFVRRALDLPPLGLEPDLKWFYYNNGTLDKIIRDSSALIQSSKASSADDELDGELAIPRLTGGGIISLERTLNKLRALAADHSDPYAAGSSSSTAS